MPSNILIADDSATIRKVIRRYFEQNSDWHVCGETDDGETAVELVRRLKPDAVVLEFFMPTLNGLDAAHRIASISPNTRIVLFTAHDSGMLRVLTAAAGIKAVVARDGQASLERFNMHCEATSQVRHKR
jgi:DNA-binding NarL/FixJ family response regulator